MNADEYLELLGKSLMQCATEDFGLVFMQDNAPIHRAKKVGEWMTSDGIEIIPCPAYSPDLNPIEDLWALVKVNKLEQPPTILTELDAAVQDVWESISLDYTCESCTKA